jgi:hypothetical protein
MNRYIYLAIAIIFHLTFSGCSPAKTIKHNQESKYYSLSAPLTQLSSYGEEFIRSSAPPAELSDSEFITKAAAHDPEILAIFTNYELHLQRGNPYVAILVCEKGKSGVSAVMEDYSCTAKLDQQLWKDAPHSSCQFTTSLATACPTEQK